MSHKRVAAHKMRWLLLVVCLVLSFSLVEHYVTLPVYGAQLGHRSLQLSDDDISVSPDYLISFDISTAGPIGSINFQFCSNDALIGDPCTAPTGFDDTNALLANQSGVTGFVINAPLSTPNSILLTRSSTFVPVGPASYHFTGIINPSVPGSYYLRVQTFATTDGLGASSDYGAMAFAIANSVAISAEVPPYLIFCTGVTISGLDCSNASGDYIDVGELSSGHASTGSSQMLVATNANSGYNVTVLGTTLTSGNNIIPALTNNDVSRPGTGQFGMNLRANVTPPNGIDPTGPGTGQPTPNYDQPNSYRFDSGDIIISNSAPDNLREYTASYLVNVPPTQAPGIYVSTLTYIALATF